MVFVLDKHKEPLTPTTEAHARKLLEKRRARVHSYSPFVIRLVDVEANDVEIHPVHLKLDPGVTKTGFALLCGSKVLMLGEITHKSVFFIKKRLEERRNLRRGRRNRKTRYRAARFDNRKKPEGWMAPSIRAWLDQIFHFVDMIARFSPLGRISYEYAYFDAQKSENRDIEGEQYQRGPLFGFFRAKHYVLAKYGHRCVYCGASNVKLELDHINPRAKDGTDRIGNLAPACRKCNQAKGRRDADEYFEELIGKGVKDAAKRYSTFKTLNAKTPKSLAASAHMNIIKERLRDALIEKYGNIVKSNDGVVTSYNRMLLKLPKTHYYDALCVDTIPLGVDPDLRIFQDYKYIGRGNRKRVYTDKRGFPETHRSRSRVYAGYMTGDIVKTVSPNKKAVLGRVTTRATLSFTIKPLNGKDKGTFNKSYKKVKRLQRGNGWVVSNFKQKPQTKTPNKKNSQLFTPT